MASMFPMVSTLLVRPGGDCKSAAGAEMADEESTWLTGPRLTHHGLVEATAFNLQGYTRVLDDPSRPLEMHSSRKSQGPSQPAPLDM
jgi:hypothetical protein